MRDEHSDPDNNLKNRRKYSKRGTKEERKKCPKCTTILSTPSLMLDHLKRYYMTKVYNNKYYYKYKYKRFSASNHIFYF